MPFSRPTIEEDEIAEVVACLRSGWITSGPRVQKFEAMFVDRLGVSQAIAVSSATAGLHLVLHALDIGPGDEVIVPSLTWVSTANMVEMRGARAVLADVNPHTLQLDPEEVRRRITSRTRAVIPVHFAGAPVDRDAIADAIKGRGIVMIEDAAHALGTAYRGGEIGSHGAIAVFSFHPTKNITTAEGGMIVCDDPDLAARLRLLRSHGISKDAWTRYAAHGSPRYEVIEPGYKYNLTDLQAALGLRQFAKLDRFNDERRRLARRYDQLLRGISKIAPVGQPGYPFAHAWHLYVVRLAPGIDRDAVIDALARENVGAGLHFLCLHEQANYRGRATLPHAFAASESILSLPLYPGLTESDQEDVVAALAKVLECNVSLAVEEKV